jgi:hypothetical protein
VLLIMSVALLLSIAVPSIVRWRGEVFKET